MSIRQYGKFVAEPETETRVWKMWSGFEIPSLELTRSIQN